MGKKLIVALEVIIIVVLMTSLAIAKEDKMIGYGGINYNDYSEADSSELGFYAGVNNWLTEDYALGVEMEFLEYSKDYTTNYEYDNPDNDERYQTEMDHEAVGLLGTFTYNLEELKTIDFYSKAGLYQISVGREDDIELGGKLGLELAQEFKGGWELNGQLGYRMVDKFEGLELGLELGLDF